LITIVPHRGEADEDDRWIRLTWQELGLLVWDVGHERGGGPTWRERALEPDATARQRILSELLAYLEENEKVSVAINAVSAADLDALSGTPPMYQRVTKLFERTAELLHPHGPLRFDHEENLSAFWHSFALPDSWAAAFTGFGELNLTVAGGDDESVTVAAGINLPQKYFEELRSQAHREWRERATQQDFKIFLKTWTRLYRRRPFVEVVRDGNTIEDQADRLAKWADETFKLARDLDPGPLVGA
jgi:hypothetical protein